MRALPSLAGNDLLDRFSSVLHELHCRDLLLSGILDRPLSTLRVGHPEQAESCQWKPDLGDPESAISTVFNLAPSTFAHGKLLSIVFIPTIKGIENITKKRKSRCYTARKTKIEVCQPARQAFLSFALRRSIPIPTYNLLNDRSCLNICKVFVK